MSVQPSFEDYTFTRENVLTHRTEIECKVNAPFDIKGILAVKGTASSIGEEIVENEVRYSGRAVFYVLTESGDGLSKAECGVEFSDKTETGGAQKVRYINYSVSGEEVRQANGGYYINATVTAEIVVENSSTIAALTGGEGILCDSDDKDFIYCADCNKGILQVDDEFELNYPVKDVLVTGSDVCLNEVASGVGAVTLDGNVFLSLSVLQNGENNVIIKESRKIPFRLELEVSGASADMKAYARAAVSKNNFKVVVDEEKNSSTVIAAIDLDAYACVYTARQQRFVRDAYSPVNVLSVVGSKNEHRYLNAQYCLSERVMGVSDFEPQDNAEVIAVVCEKAESVSVNPDVTAITGLISASVITKSADGVLSGNRAFLPFELPFSGNNGCVYRLSAAIESFNYRVRAAVEFEANLKICVLESCNACYDIITDVTVGEEKQPKTNAISIYIARGNDTLWDVCKELGASKEMVTELNPDVQFPLAGNERIIIYRNL